MAEQGATITVASFNIHAGVDGWGRPFDAVGACAGLDADVLVVQEDWAPLDTGAGVCETIAAQHGYTLFSATFARGWRYPVPADAGPSFGPGPMSDRTVGVRIDRASAAARRRHRRRGRGYGGAGAERGEWRLCLLSRLPVHATRTVELAFLRRDPARRVALIASLDLGGTPLMVVGVHMAHLKQGSLFQFAQLRRELSHLTGPAIVTGDMNLWSAPLRLLLPGWTEAVRGRTWPAWRPLAQADHILVNAGLAHANGEVVDCGGSDHLAIRARVWPQGAASTVKS
jgi:endonuclease/exonuclease/phosphatase family metal-dependent hydrolase